METARKPRAYGRRHVRWWNAITLLELESLARVSTRVIWRLPVLVGATALPAFAQTPAITTQDSLTSSIAGNVRDSLGIPVAGASILITPSGSILRTDSSGRFTARRLPAGPHTVSARKLGFAPAQAQVTLVVGQPFGLELIMQRLPQTLAEVKVTTERECPRFSIDAILCRRESGTGFFMDREQILAKGSDYPDHPTMVLRDTPGFRRRLRGNPNSVESTVGWRCIKWIYDGGFPYKISPVVKVSELYAVEVYQPPDIPPEYRHWVWEDRTIKSKVSTPCTLVVMWSMSEYKRHLSRMSGEKK